MRSLFLCLFVSTSLFAQNSTAQKEINDQVWKPFLKGFQEGNTDLFMSVHSKDVIRSPRDGKEVLTWFQYKKQTDGWNEYVRSKNLNLELRLRFTERLNNDTQAIEVGVYETSTISADGKKTSDYGRFHVVLRKENDTWKILVDTDSSEGGTIGKAQFDAAKSME